MGACGVKGQKELCLLIPEKRKLWEELISVYRYLLGKCKEVRDRLPSEMHRKNTKGNGQKLQLGKQIL